MKASELQISEATVIDFLTREKKGMPSSRRERITEFFARIPHDRARDLGRCRISGAAWVLLIEIDRLIFEGHGRNPIRFTHQNWQAAGLSRRKIRRALQQLEKAGVISVDQRPGQAPLVTHHWFPRASAGGPK
jgi:hypothetical protein